MSAGEVGRAEGIGQAFRGLGVRFVTRPFIHIPYECSESS
jgi:hypothetical protein